MPEKLPFPLLQELLNTELMGRGGGGQRLYDMELWRKPNSINLALEYISVKTVSGLKREAGGIQHVLLRKELRAFNLYSFLFMAINHKNSPGFQESDLIDSEFPRHYLQTRAQGTFVLIEAERFSHLFTCSRYCRVGSRHTIKYVTRVFWFPIFGFPVPRKVTFILHYSLLSVQWHYVLKIYKT